jgi:hypothetical protein
MISWNSGLPNTKIPIHSQVPAPDSGIQSSRSMFFPQNPMIPARISGVLSSIPEVAPRHHGLFAFNPMEFWGIPRVSSWIPLIRCYKIIARRLRNIPQKPNVFYVLRRRSKKFRKSLTVP